MVVNPKKPNKGGRPLEGNEPKNAPIAVRTTATLKARLTEAAEREGRSLTQEIEMRLERSFEGERPDEDVETARLLNMIGNEIALIERQTRKRWHRDLKTWAAVQEACANGPVRRLRPDRPNDDEAVNEAWAKCYEVILEKGILIDQLQQEGLYVEKLPKARKSIFGGSFATDDNRDVLKKQILAMDAPQAATEEMLAIVDRLVELDKLERERTAVHAEALKPFLEAESEGRSLYKNERSAAAFRAMREGQPYNIEDMI